MARSFVVAFLVLCSCASHRLTARVTPDAAAPAATLFSNINVFDGENAAGPRDVRVKDGWIVEVAEAGALTAGEGEAKVDGAGKTLLPGLVDAHAHIESHGEAIWDLGLPVADDIVQAYVYAGVTTALVMTGGASQREVQARSQAGEVVAPRLYLTGARLTAPDGFPMNLMRAVLMWPLSSIVIDGAMRGAANAEQARAAVDEAKDTLNPAFYKITCDAFPPGTPKLSAEAMTAAITHSKERGMRPAAHIGAPDDVMIAAEAGLSVFAHPPTSATFTPEQVARLAALKIPFVSTQLFLTSPKHVAEDQGSAIDREVVSAQMLATFSNRPKDFKYPVVSPDVDADALLATYEANLKTNLMALYQAGVPIFVGTDAGSPGVFPGSSIHREMKAMVAAGMPVIDVLKAATSAPADFLDPKHSYGRIAKGQRADLLVVTGDPTTDIAATQNVSDVFVAGRRMSRTH